MLPQLIWSDSTSTGPDSVLTWSDSAPKWSDTCAVLQYLMGIAAGSGLLGLYMIVCGFFQPTSKLPRPVLRFPLHYIAFHTYAFFGFMKNEFSGTDGWTCPCSVQTNGCSEAVGGASCRYQDDEVCTALTSMLPLRFLPMWSNLACQSILDYS